MHVSAGVVGEDDLGALVGGEAAVAAAEEDLVETAAPAVYVLSGALARPGLRSQFCPQEEQ